MPPQTLPFVEPWIKDCIRIHFNDQPLNGDGQPDWFSFKHIRFIERLFRWSPGDFVRHLHRLGPQLARNCSSSIFNSIKSVKAEVGPQPRVNIHGRDVPAWFAPGHNTWLEMTFGWSEGTVVRCYQKDRDLIDGALKAISEAAVLYGTIRPVKGGDPLPRYEVYGVDWPLGETAPPYPVAHSRGVSGSAGVHSRKPLPHVVHGDAQPSVQGRVSENAPALDLDFGASFAQAWDESTDSQWFDTIATGQQWPVLGPSTARATPAEQGTTPQTTDAPVLDMDDQMQIDMEESAHAPQPPPTTHIRREPVPSRSVSRPNTRQAARQVSPRQETHRPERRVSPTTRGSSMMRNSHHRVARSAPRSPLRIIRRSTILPQGL